MWRSGWLLTNQRQLVWIDYWIIQWRRHIYHRWWQLISLWDTVLFIKSPVITRSVLWRSGLLITNRGQLRWIDDWIIQWRRNRYHRRLQLLTLWVTVVAIKALVITRGRSLPTLIVPCSTFFGDWQYPLEVVWWMQYEFLVVLCACYIFCWCPTKGESQIFFATTVVMFDF